MNRRTLAQVGLVFALAALLAAPAAMAHNWGCWIQPNRTVIVRNTAVNSSQANAALNEWDADTILSIPRVSTHTEVSIYDGNYGNTGWGGLASIESASGCSILHGHATLNTYYSYTSNGKRGVFCQEVGHLFGLDHSNDGGCMGGGYFYDINTNYTVVSHNISDIASKYAGVPAGITAGEPGLGTRHADDPPAERGAAAHALWYYTPQTLAETAELASAVVVARVTGIFDAADIVVPMGTLADEFHRVPNQRIAFAVDQVLKGRLEERFDLFHTGNATFSLAGDPPYEVGETYALFVMPREDGSYVVVSPEGRYRVSRGRLEPVSERAFAAELHGTTLRGLATDLAERFPTR